MTARDPATSFGDVATQYAAQRPAYPQSIFDFLLENLSGPRTLCIDLGAGAGLATRALVSCFERVIAVDPDARMLAELSAPVGQRVCANAEEADFPEKTVAAVVAATSFHWMDQEKVIARVARWLRPSGVFFPFLYGPFFVEGEAKAVFQAHRALWTPYRDPRLGARADYSRALAASGRFAKLVTYSDAVQLKLAPESAAGLFLTASYARDYARDNVGEDEYRLRLAEDFAAIGVIDVRLPLGGVLAIAPSD